MRVHFICRGNAYRSLIAESYFKSRSNIPVLSSGVVADDYRTGNVPVIAITRKFLKAKGLALPSELAPVQLTAERLQPGDTLVCVNKEALDELKAKFKLESEPIVWDIIDYDEPGGGQETGISQYEYTRVIYKQIVKNVDQLIKELAAR